MSQHDENLIKARGDLVKKYRISSNPWPDGIDSKWDRWYIPAEWTDEGEYLGPIPMPKRPEGVDIPIVDTASVDKTVDRTDYWREKKREQRAKAKEIKE